MTAHLTTTTLPVKLVQHQAFHPRREASPLFRRAGALRVVALKPFLEALVDPRTALSPTKTHHATTEAVRS